MKALLEQARLRREQHEKVEQAVRERVEQLRVETERRRPPSSAEIVSVDREAKALIRQKFSLGLDVPGWRGLVLAEVRKLLGR